MKSWLPVLLEKLPQSPVLALSSCRNLAKGALYDRQGTLLAGGLDSSVLAAQVAEEVSHINPGECRLLVQQDQIVLECLQPTDETRRFWLSALENQQGAWASWLLTMPVLEQGNLKLTRHILSAFGPWTTPRLPEVLRDYWSLLPLKPGLGRLFVLGDDALALELAALAGRTGLTTTLISGDKDFGPELGAAKAIGDFDHLCLNSWADFSESKLEEAGIKEGVRLVVTAALDQDQREMLKKVPAAYLAFVGEAEAAAPEEFRSAVFPRAATATQKALGLLSEMLG